MSHKMRTQAMKQYRFRAGRWIVTVRAPTFAHAKIAAAAKLDQRAAKLFASPPACGWKLERLADTTRG
ncbi:exported protein of unknown function [Agrobacterium pusense]|uniref:Uncharacterized protein n=1 Tax=Agrobacterium pusense TaxID=648995 RepID=U4PXW3_9HYPH|nr:exported protein of unknown function [Agrobacterium pusense]